MVVKYCFPTNNKCGLECGDTVFWWSINRILCSVSLFHSENQDDDWFFGFWELGAINVYWGVVLVGSARVLEQFCAPIPLRYVLFRIRNQGDDWFSVSWEPGAINVYWGVVLMGFAGDLAEVCAAVPQRYLLFHSENQHNNWFYGF